jgi:uncharacterized protein YicC (UPF0701 family)
MRSMTGYGRAQKSVQGQNLSIEISSVNKRNLEIFLSGPREWQAYEIHASKKLSPVIERGRIRISISAEFSEDSQISLFNSSQITKDWNELKLLTNDLGKNSEISPDLVIALHKIRNSGENKVPALEELVESLDTLLMEAVDKLIEMKTVEGDQLQKDMIERVSQVSVLKEFSLYAEKCDISEELTRIDSHLKQLFSTLNLTGSIGRKIEFLLQELGRELNTICSKSINIECTQFALDARSELEKLREQALNIE